MSDDLIKRSDAIGVVINHFLPTLLEDTETFQAIYERIAELIRGEGADDE